MSDSSSFSISLEGKGRIEKTSRSTAGMGRRPLARMHQVARMHQLGCVLLEKGGGEGELGGAERYNDYKQFHAER